MDMFRKSKIYFDYYRTARHAINVDMHSREYDRLEVLISHRLAPSKGK